MKTSTGGIISVVAGVALILWAFVRVASPYGQMHTWTLPFSGYETSTVAMGVVGFVLLAFGVIALIKHSAGAIISIAVGVALALWALIRVRTPYGQMHTWSSPFTSYETITIATGIVGLVLLAFGIIKFVNHSRSGSLTPTQGRGADGKVQKPAGHGAVILTACVAALGGLLLGYDSGVTSVATPFLMRDFHLALPQLEFALSMMLAGALVGSAIAGYSTDRWGRRSVLLGAGIGYAIFALCSGLSTGFVSFSVSRFFAGVCIGAASLVAPLYLAEIAPAKIRGALVSLNQLAVTAGIGVASFVDFALAAHLNWRRMFMTEVFPAAILVIGMLLLTESPRWLARQGYRERALKGFHRLGRGDRAEVELANAEQAFREEPGGFRSLFRPGLRRAVMIGVILAIFSQITGFNAIRTYFQEFLWMSGYRSAKDFILPLVVIGLATVVAIALVDRLGRRFLLLVGTAGMAISAILLALTGGPFGSVRHTVLVEVLYLIIAYSICFSVSLGAVVWLLLSEMYPTTVRGQAMSFGALSVWGASWLVGGAFNRLIHAAGFAGTFWTFSAICVAAFLFCLKFVPETKGRTLEEIGGYWFRRLTAGTRRLPDGTPSTISCGIPATEPEAMSAGAVNSEGTPTTAVQHNGGVLLCSCGAEILEGAKFCGKCGKKVNLI